MADTAEMIQETQVVEQPAEQQVQLQEFERMAFGEHLQRQAPVNEEVATTTTEVAEQAATEAAVSVDYLKELGFNSIEEAKAQIEELKQLKNTQQTAVEIAFANEESKKLHQLLREGKTKEVKNYLEAQELLANVENMGDEQKLKLFIKMQNPRFDKELIDDEYNSLYKIDEDELIDDPMKLRKERLRMEQRLENDVAKAQEYFAQYKTKIELPDIEPPTLEVDKDYEAYKASNASAEDSYNKVVAPSLKSLKEADVPLTVSINDAGNKMQFDISIVPESADFEAARQDSLSLDLLKTCYDKDGNFLPKNLQKLSLLANNFEKYAQSIARQAVNAERKRVIEEETKGGGSQRDFSTTYAEPTELQKLEKMAFGY